MFKRIVSLRVVLILFAINMLYYIAYFVFLHSEMIKIDASKTSMVYFAFAIICIEFWITMIGYLLLLLKLRVGQILLAFFYIVKIYTYIESLISDGWMELRFFAEMILFIVMLVVLISSRNINQYIKIKWNQKKNLN